MLNDENVKELLPRLRRTVRYFGVHPRDVNDLVQETLTQAVQASQGFRGESTMQTWLYGIAYNVVRNHRKKVSRDHSIPTDPGQLPEHTGSLSTSGGLDTEGESRRFVLEVLGKLREEERDVILLVSIEKMTPENAARILQLSEEHLKLVLREAKEKIRALASGRDQT